MAVCHTPWSVSDCCEDCLMKRELSIAGCGLACCLCTENDHCAGCDREGCPDKDRCENLACLHDRGLTRCHLCPDVEGCRKGLLSKIKPYGFSLFARRYGEETLLDCLERNERDGVRYHRDGLVGDYDDFTDVEALISFIMYGARERT